MNRALKVLLGVEIVLGVLWTLLAAMAHGAGGLAVAGWFIFVYALYAGFFLFATWVYWKYPDTRRIAGWIMALPILFWFLPLTIRSLAGGVLTTQQLSTALIVLAITALGACWIAPRKATAIIPNVLLRSRLFNWLIILAIVAAWSFFVFVIVYVVNAKSPSTSGTGEGLAYAIVLATIYLLWLGIGSFFAATWAWLSLRGGTETATRKLNIAQVFFASPGALVGITGAAWLTGEGGL